jgi:hypothetical protein
MKHQVSQPYETTGRIMVLYILTFIFLDSEALTTHPIYCKGRKWVGAIPPLPPSDPRRVVGQL